MNPERKKYSFVQQSNAKAKALKEQAAKRKLAEAQKRKVSKLSEDEENKRYQLRIKKMIQETKQALREMDDVEGEEDDVLKELNTNTPSEDAESIAADDHDTDEIVEAEDEELPKEDEDENLEEDEENGDEDDDVEPDFDDDDLDENMGMRA